MITSKREKLIKDHTRIMYQVQYTWENLIKRSFIFLEEEFLHNAFSPLYGYMGLIDKYKINKSNGQYTPWRKRFLFPRVRKSHSYVVALGTQPLSPWEGILHTTHTILGVTFSNGGFYGGGEGLKRWWFSCECWKVRGQFSNFINGLWWTQI